MEKRNTMNNEKNPIHIVSIESIGGSLGFMDALETFAIAQTAADVAVETDGDYAIHERSAARQMQNLIAVIDSFAARQLKLTLDEIQAGKQVEEAGQ